MASDPTVPPPQDSPPLLDRAGLERVLARATELQSAVGDSPEALSEQQLLDLGSEVGIAPEHLRQALAEEQRRGLLPPETGLEAALAGASSIAAARVVSGTPASVLTALDSAMQRDEVLVLKRRFPERLTWEAQHGLIGRLRRGLALGGRRYHLARATDVSAGVAAVDGTRVHVRLVANFGDVRTRRLEMASVVALALLLTAAPLFAIDVTPALAILPPVLMGSVVLAVTRRRYRRMLARTQVALEQVLDKLEYEPSPPSPARALLDAIAGPPRLGR